MTQIIWKNASWICQRHWRRTLRLEVCHLKRFYAVNNNDTSFEDFESLAANVEKENLDNCSESELVYFANEPLKGAQESAQPIQRKIPVKQTLAYTNKALYGPLLESAAERKRKSKVSQDVAGIRQNSKIQKKPRKNKPVSSMQPLISKPENAHLLGIFPSDDLKQIDKFHSHKVKIEHQNETINTSDSVSARPRNKILLFKKATKDSVKHENLIFHDIRKIKKIYVSSWEKEKETHSSTNTDKSTGWSEQTSEDNLSESSAAENKSTERTPLVGVFSSVINGSDQEIENLKSFGGNSMLSVDNEKFTAAPNIIDIQMIENFPLEKTESLNMLNKTVTSTDENVVTIGMFDNGYQRLPSVSKILEATMSENERKILQRWKTRMIKELGEEGFEIYRKGLFDKGKLLHGCIYSELTGTSPSVENMPTVQGLWTSISHILPKISNVSVLESRLIHPYLYYQGAVDCVATYRGMPMLIDWKTSTKPKLTLNSMFDSPLQVVAYLGALNYDNNYQFPHQVQSAMLVVAYDSGLPAHVHIIDKEKCQEYWKVWCAKLIEFWRQFEVKESV